MEKQQQTMQKDSGNHRANGVEDHARYLAISEQRSNWKQKPTNKITYVKKPSIGSKIQRNLIALLDQHKTTVSSQNILG